MEVINGGILSIESDSLRVFWSTFRHSNTIHFRKMDTWTWTRTSSESFKSVSMYLYSAVV